MSMQQEGSNWTVKEYTELLGLITENVISLLEMNNVIALGHLLNTQGLWLHHQMAV
ncbi:hypothetical protein PROFUN_15260, partial [Planoprotostelium fungivorum]